MRRRAHTSPELALTRWSPGPVIVALGVGIAIGPWGLHLLHPLPADDAAAITTLAQLALIACLFALGLRLRVPLEWRAWRLPVRLLALSLPLTVVLMAGAAYLILDLSFAQSLIVGAILAPLDPVLACSLHPPSESLSDTVQAALGAEAGMSSALAAPLVLVLMGLAGMDPAGSPLFVFGSGLGSLVLGAALGWSVGRGAWHGIRLLDRDRNGDLLEELSVLAAGVLAYTLATAVHAEALTAVLCAGLALGQAGGVQQGLGRRGLGRRVLRISGRLERLAGILIMMLIGALLGVVDLNLRILLVALIAPCLVRPLSAGIAVSGAGLPSLQRRILEWSAPRGAAVLYAAGVAVDRGVGASMGRELWALAVVTAAATLATGALAAAAQRVNSAGTVDLR